MIKTILIDDEPLARSIIKEYLENHSQLEVVAECNDGFEGVKAIAKHQPALIFLDVQMPKINGFEMLELIDEPPAVIFTTAFDEYAMKAFEANGVDYLLKPFSQQRFDKAVEKFISQQKSVEEKTVQLLLTQNLPGNAERIVVKIGSNIKIIPVSEITYLEAADDYVKIHTKEGSFLKNKTMAYFEASLNSSIFVRTHRSFIVNVQQVTKIEPYEKENFVVVLKNGTKVPVSKTGYGKLKTILGL